MKIWILLRDTQLTEDRAYVMGHLRTRFDDIIVTRVSRLGTTIPEPPRGIDLILNLSGSLERDFHVRLDDLADRLGVPISPRGTAAWLATDKRLYPDVFGDVAPPTRIANSLDAIEAARRDLGGDVIVKDPLGGKGTGMVRLMAADDLIQAEPLLNGRGGTTDAVVQQFMPGFLLNEKRIVVQRDATEKLEVIGHFRRIPPPGSFCANISRGGTVATGPLADAERDLAIEMTKRSGLDNSAVDIGEDNGQLYFIEHNVSFGGVIDHDFAYGTKSVRKIGDFFEHLARYGTRRHAYS